jgi:putative pyruvate formate lyase activating enzyme
MRPEAEREPWSRELMRFVADKVSRDAYVNIMDQYRVVRRASPAELEHSPCLAPIKRSTTGQEYGDVVECARRAKLHRCAR